MTYTIGGPNALTQHIFDDSTTPLCGQSFGDDFEALLEEKGAPPKTLESEMNRDGADAAIAVGLCENCREKYAENESGEIAEVFESMDDDRASVESDPAADDELVTDGGTDVEATGEQHDPEYLDPLHKVDDMEEVEVECAVEDDAIPECDGWSETVELDEPANYVNGRIELPGFNWECPECGNPHEFKVEGMWVTNLV